MKRTVTALLVGVVLTVSAKCEASTAPEAAPSTATSAASSVSAAPSTPKVETRTVTETKPIPFKTKKVDDPTLPEGITKVRNRGVPGEKTLTYKVTFTDETETGRELIREQVTKEPVNRVIAMGTKQTSQCDPNYSGACVPIASDVDCEGGTGNGPAYVTGPVRIIGNDIYDLDRDGDNLACDD